MAGEETAARNMLWAELIAEELCRLDVENVCISPGSRSTPLTLGAAENERLRTHIHFDERATAFMALGLAKATQKPVALICTSGTAVANYLPAVIEASMDHVPLILLTSDRPPELQQVMANQSIVQQGVFGNYVRFHFQLPCPARQPNVTLPLSVLDQAVDHAMAVPRGPVHVNCQFREPFVPEQRIALRDIADLEAWRKSNAPFVKRSHAVPSLSQSGADRLSNALNAAQRGVLVVGRSHHPLPQSIIDLCEDLQWPVIADIGSGLPPCKNVLNHADLLLLSTRTRRLLDPDLVLCLGGPMTSKRLLLWQKNLEYTQIIRIQDHPAQHNPNRQSISVIEAQLYEAARLIRSATPKPHPQLESLLEADRHCAAEVKVALEKGQLSGLHLAQSLRETLPTDHGLFLGNSFTVREMDMLASRFKGQPVCLNRGASGIDGNIATAVGYAAGLEQKVTVVIGDLTALHDLNSFHLLARSAQPIILVVVNNDGGGIFHALPISDQTPHFDECFATPHGRSFAKVAEMFELEYTQIDSKESWTSAYKEAVEQERSHVIEVVTDREATWALYKSIQLQLSHRI